MANSFFTDKRFTSFKLSPNLSFDQYGYLVLIPGDLALTPSDRAWTPGDLATWLLPTGGLDSGRLPRGDLCDAQSKHPQTFPTPAGAM
eukprot:gene29793-7428_t